MNKVFIVHTEDGEVYAFSSEKKANEYALKRILEYAEEIGAPLYEVGYFANIEELEVDEVD